MSDAPSTAEGKDPEALLTVPQIVEEFGLGESTVWLYLRRFNVARLRMPGRGRTIFVRRGEFTRAMETPVPVDAPAATDEGKAAA